MEDNSNFPLVPRYKVLSRIPEFVKNPVPILTEFHEKYGDTYYMHSGGVTKSLVTRDPEVIREIMQRQHRNVEKSELQTKTVANFVGKGLLTNTGSDWLRQRRLIQPGFHRDKIENLIGLMMEVIRGFEKKVVQAAGTAGAAPINFSNFMQDLSFDIITRTLISAPIPEEDLKVMNQVVIDVQHFIVKQVRLPFLQPYFKISGQVRKHKEMVKVIRKQLLGYVNDRRGSQAQTDDLLDMLLAARYEDSGQPMEDERLIDEMLILFVAGHETSANALSWTFYLLSQHPEMVAKIREEAKALFAAPLSLQSLKQLELTDRVLQESMRLYPPAWVTDRITTADVILDGKKVPKGTYLIPFIYGVHHHPDYWPRPETFDPDRFLAEQQKSRKPYTHLPFGGGPRFCIGNNFSMMEMQLVVAFFCHHFDFEMVGQEEKEIKPLITLRMKEDAMMYWKKRE